MRHACVALAALVLIGGCASADADAPITSPPAAVASTSTTTSTTTTTTAPTTTVAPTTTTTVDPTIALEAAYVAATRANVEPNFPEYADFYDEDIVSIGYGMCEVLSAANAEGMPSNQALTVILDTIADSFDDEAMGGNIAGAAIVAAPQFLCINRALQTYAAQIMDDVAAATDVAPSETTEAPKEAADYSEDEIEAAFVYHIKQSMVDSGYLEVSDFEYDSIVGMGEEMCNIVDSYVEDGYSPEEAMTDLANGAMKRDDPKFVLSMYLTLLGASPGAFCPEHLDYSVEMFEWALG